MKRIKLTRSKYALVDDEDFDRINKYRWYVAGTLPHLYAQRYIPVKKTITMHREIMGNPPRLSIDHINHNTLDNRKCNLRYATNSQQAQNKKERKGKSEYKGVNWCSAHSKWRATISSGKRRLYLGLWSTEQDAAISYNIAAIQHFGEFAYLNHITYGNKEKNYSKTTRPNL